MAGPTADEPLHKDLLRLVVGAGGAATTVVLIGDVANVNDGAMQAFGLGVATVLAIGIVLQVLRWRERPEGSDGRAVREWSEPRTLAVAGVCIGTALFLVPSPTSRGWALVPIGAAFLLVACLARWLLFELCRPRAVHPPPSEPPASIGPGPASGPPASSLEGDAVATPEADTPVVGVATAFPAPLVEEPARQRRPTVVAASVVLVLVAVGLVGFLGGKGKLSDLFADKPAEETVADGGEEDPPDQSSQASDTTSPPTSPAPEPTVNPLDLQPASEDVCQRRLLLAGPTSLVDVWLAELDYWGWKLACPDSTAPSGEIYGFHFKSGVDGTGEFMGDSDGHGAFVFEPLVTQLEDLLPDRDLAVMGGAPTRRYDCGVQGNIVLFVDHEGRPRGVALRSTKTSGGRATPYVLIVAADFETWWQATVERGQVQFTAEGTVPLAGPLPTTVDEVIGYC